MRNLKSKPCGLFVACAALAVSLASPAIASAAPALEVSGWIPYWRVSEGTKDTKRHISAVDAIHPFGFSVREDGSLNDLAKLKKSAWKKFLKSARSNDVEILPTVMWSDGANIHAILSDKDLRERHIEEITDMVSGGRYDGVDIDYEGKLAETKDHFSLFLKELKAELGSKTLSCTIEARTPPDSLYAQIPDTIRYANDYAAIDDHCDRVNIMAYDQGRADIKLNSLRRGAPYIPVADTDWVRKVALLASKSISKDKIVLGVPTYGYEYEVTVSPNWFQGYRRLWSVGHEYAVETADDFHVEPSRNPAGEMGFSYLPKSSKLDLKRYDAPRGTASGNTVALKALAYANATGETVTFNYVTWSDAGALEAKMRLAEELGLRGVAIFKFDGAQDPETWNKLED